MRSKDKKLLWSCASLLACSTGFQQSPSSWQGTFFSLDGKQHTGARLLKHAPPCLCRQEPVRVICQQEWSEQTETGPLQWTMLDLPISKSYAQLIRTSDAGSNPSSFAPQTMHGPNVPRTKESKPKSAQSTTLWPYEDSQSIQICLWVTNPLSCQDPRSRL